MSFLTKIFAGGAEKVIGAVGGVLDNLITNKEELAAAKLAMEAEVNRHVEAMELLAHKGNELENADRDSARAREVAHIKATGRADWFMYFTGGIVLTCFAGVVVFLLNKAVPEENTAIVHNLIGLLEGATLAVVTFYFGSSRIAQRKDLPG